MVLDKQNWEISATNDKLMNAPNQKNLSFDILELLKFCSKLTKIDYSNHYINSLDIIQEFPAKSEVKTKLTNLEFDFVKK